MRTRKEINADIEKYGQAITRLQSDLSAAEQKGQALQQQVENDLIEGKEGPALQQLNEHKTRVEATRQALTTARAVITATRAELEHLNMAEKLQEWAALEPQIFKLLDQVQAVIGEQGLNQQVAAAFEQVEAAKPYAARLVDGAAHAGALSGTLADVSRGLQIAWQAIETVRYFHPNPKPRDAKIDDRLPGFGKTLHR